jgi:hypothetical protein
MERIKESVLPSGIQFSVRNLIGEDQDNLTREQKKSSGTPQSVFNKMLAGAMRGLGNKSESEITPNMVAGMLSNDRKFALITLRQHTLEYQPTFDFKYEWPLQKGEKKKQAFDYSVSFDHENFPVIPYRWMREALEKLKQENIENSDFKMPDGHIIPFPKLYDNYLDMKDLHKEQQRTLSNGQLVKWDLLDGEMELANSSALNDDPRMNLIIEMRKPKYKFADGEKSPVWAEFTTGKTDMKYLEEIRKEMLDFEGKIDTSLVIGHENNPRLQMRVDLCQLPAFFFPSLGQ